LDQTLATALIGDLLERGSISPNVSAPTKRQALCVISEIAARSWGVKASRVLDALSAREAASPTGVGYGVALPHAQVPDLQRMRGVFLRLRPPIDFGAVDDEPVDLVFAILGPAGAEADHLRTLARVARGLRSPDLRRQLRQAVSADAIHALLSQEVRPSAA
jgi:PTS system nitrogen regulatory IIA component